MSHMTIHLAALYRKVRELGAVPFADTPFALGALEAVAKTCATGKQYDQLPPDIVQALRTIMNSDREPGSAAVLIVANTSSIPELFKGSLSSAWTDIENEVRGSSHFGVSEVSLLNMKVAYVRGMMQCLEHTLMTIAEKSEDEATDYLEDVALQMQMFISGDHLTSLYRDAALADEKSMQEAFMRATPPTDTRH